MNVVITGAGKGIGFELAKNMSNEGHKVMAVSRNIDGLKALASPNLIPISFDIKQTEKLGDLVSQIRTQLGTIDILINNAGFLVKKEYSQFSLSDFQSIYNTNVQAPFFLIQSLSPVCNKGAHIVNIGSMGGITNTAKFPGMSLYSSSKAALAVLTECLATELKEQDVFINCLALGAANTEMVREAFPGYSAPVSASQMANYIQWFALNGAKWFNGQVLPVALSSP